MNCFLTDFGLAKSVTTGSRLTRTGQSLGTPTYMSPEQARGEVSGLTPATDVWGLGCLLYEMVCGRTPFGDDSAAAVLQRVVFAEPPDPRRTVPGLPRDVADVVAACLAKRAGERAPDAAALREDLDRLLRGERPRRRPRRRRWRALVAAGALAGAAALAALVGTDGAAKTPAAPGPSPHARAEALAARARERRLTAPAEGATWLEEALGAAPEHPSAAAWRVERGLLLWAAGRGDEAREEWGRVPAGAPERAGAILYRGLEADFRLEGDRFRAREARPDLLAAAEGGGREAAIARAAIALQEGRWQDARRELGGVAGWEAHLLRGEAEIHDPAGDAAAGEASYTAALAEAALFPWVHVHRAAARWSLGDRAGAIEDVGHALRLMPGDPLLLRNRAGYRLGVGDLAGALEDVEAALAVKPDDSLSWHFRAEVRLSLGDPAGAASDTEKALRLEPGLAPARVSRGNRRAARGDHARALEDFEAALAGAPGLPEALLGRGNVRHAQGDLGGAAEDFASALSRDPHCYHAAFNLGNVRRDQGDLGRAVEAYTEALRVGGDVPEAYFARGHARDRLGDLAAAESDYSMALRLRPDFKVALNNRGSLQMRRGDLDRAASDFREAVRVAPDYPEALANLGQVLRMKRDWRGAAEALRRALEVAPGIHDHERLRAWLEEAEARLREGSR